MSKGSPYVPIRLQRDLLAEVELTINRRNLNSRECPWDRTGFIVTAIREKIAKMARSRDRSKRRKGLCKPS